MTTTRLSVEVRDGRHQVRSSAGLLRAQRLHGPADRARVALVGQTALLLGGDQVGLDIEVGPGARARSCPTSRAPWPTTGGGGRRPGTRASGWGGEPGSRYAGEPLILSDGSDVTRTLTVDLAEGAAARLRETLVFGRAGEVGGTAGRGHGAAPRGRRSSVASAWCSTPRPARGRGCWPGCGSSTRCSPSVAPAGRAGDQTYGLGRGSAADRSSWSATVRPGDVPAARARQHAHPLPGYEPGRLAADSVTGRLPADVGCDLESGCRVSAARRTGVVAADLRLLAAGRGR